MREANDVPKQEGAYSLVEYLRKRAGIDVEISPEMARLVRARLLCIVNRDVEKKGQAVPITDLDLLCDKVSKSARNTAIKRSLNLIVDGLQQEEAQLAVSYVRSLRCDGPRGELIQCALSDVRASKRKGIVSVPLTYNMEAVLRSYSGIVCVKNKLLFCGKPMEGALRKRVFIKLPEEQLVKESGIPDDEPLIVVEGYVPTKTDLKNTLVRVGFMNMVLSNCARIKQYASKTSQVPLCAEVEADLARYRSADFNEANSCMRIDHVCC
jgi:hypothetical protein